jgi:hypothetical protein
MFTIFVRVSPTVTHAVGSDVCWYCQEQVNLVADQFNGTLTWSRINGDSKYGYEPCHARCSAEVAAERACDAVKPSTCPPESVAIEVDEHGKRLCPFTGLRTNECECYSDPASPFYGN